MKIAFNPSTAAALTTPPNNKDITFDLRGRNIFARGVKFYGTDTNTWRDIKVNNVSIGSHTLDLRNGGNTTLTNTNGVVTINSTWRPVVDNLTSDSTTSSLSANQGRVLKALIDGKSNSGHTHDDRYLKLSGGTMTSDALIRFADSGSWGTDKGPQGARGGLYWSGQSDYAKLYAEETAGDNLDLVIQFGDDNSNGLSVRNKTNTQTSYISASGVITTGTFKGNLDWSYITNKPSSYTPSAHTHAWNSLTHSSTTANQAILTNGSANGWKLYTLNISAWDNAASKAHSHSNKAVIDGITSTHVSNWNTAYTFVHTITGTDTDKVINKWDEIVNFLAGIDSNNKLNTLLNSKLSVYELADKTNVGTIKNNGIYYSTTDASSGTLTNSPFSNGFALINMTSYDGGDYLRRSRLAFNAFGEIKVSDDRDQANTAETWYNVLTSKNSGISGSTIKLNGTSITVYSSGTADGRYVKKSGDTMTGALNFANATWNKVGDDSYVGDCNVSGHFGIRAANTTYPGIAFFNNANAHLGSLTAYSGNIKYGAYSLQFLDNGNTSVGASTWTNPFSAYDKDAVKDGQAICVWGQSSHLSNLASDSGDMSLWLKRVNAKAATLNMVLDGEYYANGSQRLAHISEIPGSLKNPNAIKFKDINGNVVTYDGSAAKDLTAGTYIAKLPYGFASFASGATWGNTTGTSFASWNDSTGGSIDFRRDNPSAGKMSIKVDGRVYVNEGRNPVLSAESNNGFWGMRTPDGGNDWIRTPNNGLIPYISGNAGSGHSSLGASGWYFSTAYIDKVYGSLKGNADTASSANKLTTARNIALRTDLRGSANFDGSGNITINANINACTVSVGSTDKLPFKRIAHFETGDSWNDNALLLYISEGYINGRNGICRVEFRTENISSSSTSISASAGVRWLVRNNYGLDALYAGYYVTADKAYIDIYLKTAGSYRGTVIRVLQDSRGGINSNVQLISARYNNENDHKEAYSSIEAASTALYNRAYTRIVSGSDSGIVNYANSTGSTTKLQTARKLWGQSFDGTKDISGSLSGTGSITPGSAGVSSIGSNSLDYRYGYFHWIGAKSGQKLELGANNSGYGQGLCIDTNLNVGIGTNSPAYKLDVRGDTKITGSIRDLSIGGGIYWNPYVESATDGSDAASITVVKAGVAGGTTLVLSQQNDANDTIQFKTSTAARLYHNSNQILTSGDTKVSSGKGYINNTEITQVNNAGSASKIVNWYSARPTSLNKQFGDGSLRIFYATSTTTEGKSPADATVLHLAWDNNGGRDSQLAISSPSSRVYTRSQNNGTWQPWKTLAFTTDIPTTLKNPAALTTFGVVYDGSAAKVVNPSNFISQVNEATTTITDGTMFITSYASNSGFADTSAVNVPYKRKALHLWEYIKAKTDSLYATKSHNHDNKYLKWLGNAGQSNMNAIGRISHSSGMTALADPGNTTDNPMEGGSKSTSWHLYWQTNYTDDPSGSNAWVAQIVNRAGTDRWWVRSRSGGTITNGTGWASNWRFLVTAPTSGLGNGNQPIYINSAGEVVAANSYPTSLRSPHALTLKANGTTLATYDGSSAKEANFTYANVGAASASHTHSYYAVNENYGGFKKAERLPTSGFYQSYISDKEESGGNAPWKGWMHLINCQHSTTGNNYALQIAAGFNDNNIFKIRVTDNNVDNAWRNIIHSGNIGQQSVKYATSAGSATSATKVIVNQHTSNAINYPLVWSNQSNTSNVTENQLYKSWADLYYNPKNKRLTVGGSVVTSSFIKSGGTNQQLLRADGGVAAFNWTGQSGQPTWLWGGNDFNSYYVYNPSNFRVAYASSAGNADTLDGEHASSFVRAGAIEVGSPDLNALDTYSFIKSVNSQVAGHSPKGNIGWYNVIQLVHRNGADDGASYIGQIALGMTTNTNDMFFRGKRTDPWKTVIHSGNIGSQTVANAYHLHINSANSWSTWNWAGQSGQPSWLWGSNDGTNMYVWNPSNFNVNSAQYLRSLGNKDCQTGRTQAYGDVYTYNTYNGNTGSPTTYSSVIGFGRGTGGTVEIAGGWCNTNLYWRSLGDCCENWFSWRAVLDESNYASVLNNTYLPLAGGTMKGNARIGHGSGSLYIGNSGNDGWLYVQDMASQAGEANWKIYANGFATFKNLTVNGPTVVNGSTTLNSVTTLNGLVTNNRGILPASYDVNKNNTGCYVWGDAMSTGVTAITDALDPKYVSVHYSNDNGTSWSDMKMSNQDKFCLYANNGSREAIHLGANRTSDLAQIQKNQLMVTFEIPSTMYSALCWASIDISQGVQTTCTVEIIAKDATIKNTFTKNLYGWSWVNYINFWGGATSVVNIGQDSARFVRFKFKHDANNTQVRNALIYKIRLFSFTKFAVDTNDFRSQMAYTGHLYTYDQNLNVKFPNALNVGGTLTITPTSNGYYEEANYPGAVIDTYYNNNYLQIGKSNGELILDTNSDKGNINPALYIKDFVSANRLFKFNTGLAVPPVHLMNAFNADDTITIQGEKYNAYYVGTQGNAIGKSFILADNSINHKQVIVIRKGVDGEICFIKDAGEETFRYYLQNTQLMLAGDHTIQKSGTFSFGFDDGKARFIIYSERNNTWYEFHCG